MPQTVTDNLTTFLLELKRKIDSPDIAREILRTTSTVAKIEAHGQQHSDDAVRGIATVSSVNKDGKGYYGFIGSKRILGSPEEQPPRNVIRDFLIWWRKKYGTSSKKTSRKIRAIISGEYQRYLKLRRLMKLRKANLYASRLENLTGLRVNTWTLDGIHRISIRGYRRLIARSTNIMSSLFEALEALHRNRKRRNITEEIKVTMRRPPPNEAWWWLPSYQKRKLQEERLRGRFGGENAAGVGRAPYFWVQEMLVPSGNWYTVGVPKSAEKAGITEAMMKDTFNVLFRERLPAIFKFTVGKHLK